MRATGVRSEMTMGKSEVAIFLRPFPTWEADGLLEGLAAELEHAADFYAGAGEPQ